MQRFNPEALTEQVQAQMQAAMNRDPRHFSWGLFAWADGPPACGGGDGAFQWFANQEQLMAFLSASAPAAFMTFDHEDDWNRQCAQLREIVQGWNDDPRGTVERLNAALQGLLFIEWIGTFADLRTGMDSFSVALRQEFAGEMADANRERGALPTNDVALDWEQAFVAFLPDYGH